MVVSGSLIKKIILEIVKETTGKAWKSLSRKDKVLKILKAVGLESKPKSDFESVYAHALVEYGVEKPEAILNFFRHEDIQKAFRESFTTNDYSILSREAEHLIDWNKIGDELREQKLDPRTEFAGFGLIFNEMVNLSCSPAQIRSEQKLDEILRMISGGDLKEIRAKNLEMIQGSLAEQLKAWFKALGYSFEGHDLQTEEYKEWIIRIPARRGYERILVQCSESRAEHDDMKRVRAAVAEQRTDEGWLICAHRKAKSAKKIADHDDKIFCFTFDELLDEHADFIRYFNWLKDFVTERNIDTEYIPLACKRDVYDQKKKEKAAEERYGQEEGWIEGYIDRWLEDPCKEHISILGEFGTGKTWFTHHYAYLIMEQYLEAKRKGLKRPRLPLVIQLRDYSKALNSESLFSDFFFRKHEVPLPGYSAFEQLNRMGKLLLIFDGFDEMADKLDRQKMINNFWELARVVVPGAKAILTCRTEHFPNAREGRSLLNAELKASTANLTGDPPQFEVLDLEMFNEGQIRTALLKRTDEMTVDFIMGHRELLDLAARPVMLEFILDALPDIEDKNQIDLSRVYLYAIKAKLERDIKSERTFTSMADKLYFMCELSWEMLTTEKMSLNYRLFPDRLQALFGEIISEQKDLDHWHYDMMGNTLLIRNDDGDYSPAHRSLLEFFVALKLVAELGVLPADFTGLLQNQSNINSSLDPIDYTWDDYFQRGVDKQGEIKSIPPLKRFCSEKGDRALASIGMFGEAVWRFVHEITNVEDVRFPFHQMLTKVLGAFKGGSRAPEKQQDLLTFIIKFRRLSQEWEEQANRGDSIRQFWKKHHDKEVKAARDKTKFESIVLKKSGLSPIKIEMARVPAGTFLMGDEEVQPIHRVTITRPFLMAKVQVTQELYRAVMEKNPSDFKADDLPVNRVSWDDAVRFCNELSIMLDLEPAYNIVDTKVEWIQESCGFRLPSEAEWEYACRAGATSRFFFGDLESDLETTGWYIKNIQKSINPVGQKEPNTWGLYDMHGNVWEWVWNRYGRYPDISMSDPTGPIDGPYRVIRGGGWGYSALRCRSAFRGYDSPDLRGYDLGFRLSRSVALGT